MNIGDRIFELRKKSGLSQEELGNSLNVSRQSVSKWEMDQSVPELDKVLAMSELFKVKTDYLLKGEVEQDSNKVTFNPIILTYAGVLLAIIGVFVIYPNRMHFWHGTGDRHLIGIILQIIGLFMFVISMKVYDTKPGLLSFLLMIWALLFHPLLRYLFNTVQIRDSYGAINVLETEQAALQMLLIIYLIVTLAVVGLYFVMNNKFKK